jgi:predicted esterase
MDGQRMKRVARLLMLGLAAVAATAGRAVAAEPAADLAQKLKEPPKSELDKTLRDLIGDYQRRIGELDASKPLVKANLARLRRKLVMLYEEYNRPNRKRRYRRDHFTPAEALAWLKHDMGFLLDRCLLAGRDPQKEAAGKWHGRACWLSGTNIMGRYDLQAPDEYDPKKPWPIVISYQDNPDRTKLGGRGYFLLRSIQKGYPRGLVAVRNKTRSYLKDVAADFRIDPFRVYATGFSYGGHTDLTMAWQHPHWFAAIAPVCSDLRGEQAPNVKYLKNVPTLLLHGDHDSFLRTGKIVHQYMVDAGCPVEFRTYAGGHNPGPVFRGDVGVLTDFFAKHVMNPFPKIVSHVVTHKRYSRAFWVNAKLTKDAAGMVGTVEVRVRDAKRIEIDANEQIAALTLDLNDKLVDMGKPVIVVADGKVLYQGKPSAELQIRLREGQDFFQRPGDRLWQEIVEIQKGAAYSPGPPAAD